MGLFIPVWANRHILYIIVLDIYDMKKDVNGLINEVEKLKWIINFKMDDPKFFCSNKCLL